MPGTKDQTFVGRSDLTTEAGVANLSMAACREELRPRFASRAHPRGHGGPASGHGLSSVTAQ